MTESRIQLQLWHDLHATQRIIVPNYTPERWMECDLFAVTKAGFWSEHEIKLSVTDFKADRKKTMRHDQKVKGWYHLPYQSKHELLGGPHVDALAPSRYWFVMPEAVAGKVEIPVYAGLKVVTQNKSGKINIEVKKEAPKLHGFKISDDVSAHAVGVCYWRFWNQRTRFVQEVESVVKRHIASLPCP